ncbi:hypothetical protein CAMRE0001_2378 [Campylobacter rectus RM3267]|uniref:Uncharacterized protein n=1 Tax=Campylobacter rectus RM3267 TaxID=553218 RepID=B9D1M9_CAMRE|nr:hypothetical protein CAMRE0001_2378 [Campylobacter rectus RM3267]
MAKFNEPNFIKFIPFYAGRIFKLGALNPSNFARLKFGA